MSLRWINDEFQDHTTNFLKNNDMTDIFNPLRQTYFWSHKTTGIRKIDGSSSTSIEYIPKEILSLYPIVKPTKTLTEDMEETLKKDKSKAISNKFRVFIKSFAQAYTDCIPELGYEHVLNILSKYGNVSKQDFNTIKQMNIDEGMNYFVNSLVPTMINFVENKKN